MGQDGSGPPRPIAIIRTLLFGVVVFAVALPAGALLANAAPAVPHLTPAAAEVTERSQQTEAMVDPMLGPSLIYTGAAALVVSVVGLVIVARRRRLW
jgi:hypothetical protein